MMTRRVFAILLLAASGTILSLHVYLGSYTRLMADDFCSVYFARRLGMLRYIWYWYLNWGGRYSAIAVDSFIESIAPDRLGLVTLFVILIWLAITSIALHQVLRKEVSYGQSPTISLALAALFLVTVLTVSPMAQQVLYWWNGMRTYIPALISATFYIGFLYWAADRLNTRRRVLAGSLFGFLIALFSGGFNETFTTVQFLFFAGSSGLGLLTKRLRRTEPFFYLLVAATIASALSLLIMLTSPGATLRREYFTAAPDVVTTLAIALDAYGKYLSFLFTSIERVLTLTSLTLVSIWVGTNAERKNSSGWIISVSLGSGILLSFASLVPSAYTFSEMPAPRTFIVPTFILIVSLLFAGLMTGKWWAGNSGLMTSIYARSRLMMLICICVLCSTWLNTRMLYSRRDTYIDFAERWDLANAQIIEAKLAGAESVVIPALGNWAGLEEPNHNPKYWVTQCYSLYYDFQVFGPNPVLQQP